MKWVTREQVGVDRMAGGWLITTYIDSQADFLFVPAGHTPLPEGAEPFDIPGVQLSHHWGILHLVHHVAGVRSARSALAATCPRGG